MAALRPPFRLPKSLNPVEPVRSIRAFSTKGNYGNLYVSVEYSDTGTGTDWHPVAYADTRFNQNFEWVTLAAWNTETGLPVPTMTSPPSGSGGAQNLTNGQFWSRWQRNTEWVSGEYIKADFGETVDLTAMEAYTVEGYIPQTIKIEGSANDSDWTDLGTHNWGTGGSQPFPEAGSWTSFEFSGTKSYRYWRISPVTYLGSSWERFECLRFIPETPVTPTDHKYWRIYGDDSTGVYPWVSEVEFSWTDDTPTVTSSPVIGTPSNTVDGDTSTVWNRNFFWDDGEYLQFEFAAPNVTHTADAHVVDRTTKTHTADGHVVDRTTKTHTTDAHLTGILKEEHTTDAVLFNPGEETHFADARLVDRETVAHTTDAVLQPTPIAHTSDAHVVDRTTVTHTADAILQPTPIIHTTDAVLYKSSVTHTTDAKVTRSVRFASTHETYKYIGTGSSWVTIATINGSDLEASSEYVLMLQSMVKPDSSTRFAETRIQVGGTTVTDSAQKKYHDSYDYYMHSWMDKYTTGSTPGDVTFQILQVSDEWIIENAVLTAIKIDDLEEGVDYSWTEHTTSSSHTTSYADRVSKTFTPTKANDPWIAFGSYQVDYGNNVTSNGVEGRFVLDGSTYFELKNGFFGTGSGITGWFPINHPYNSLSAASHTIKIQTRDDASGAPQNTYQASKLFLLNTSAFRQEEHTYTSGTTAITDAEVDGFGYVTYWTEIETITITVDVSGYYMVVGDAAWDWFNFVRLQLDDAGTAGGLGYLLGNNYDERTYQEGGGSAGLYPAMMMKTLFLPTGTYDIDLDGAYDASGRYVRESFLSVFQLNDDAASITHTTDAHLTQAGVTTNHTADAHLVDQATKTHTTDTVLIKTVAHATDAVLAGGQSHQTDAILQATVEVEHDTDATLTPADYNVSVYFANTSSLKVTVGLVQQTLTDLGSPSRGGGGRSDGGGGGSGGGTGGTGRVDKVFRKKRKTIRGR